MLMTFEPQAAQHDEASVAKIAALSTALIDAVNARDWDVSSGIASEFIQHLAPGFRSQSDITSQQEEKLSLSDQIGVWKERGLQHPQAQFEVIDVDTKLLDANQASVFISMRVIGVDGVMLHAMNEFQWSRVGNGRWQCNRLIGLRGTFGSAGTIGYAIVCPDPALVLQEWITDATASQSGGYPVMAQDTFSTTSRWGETAESYKTHVDRLTQTGAAELISMADDLRPIDSSSHILDNGAGSGAVCRRIIEIYPEALVLATDINKQMLDTITADPPSLEKRVVDALDLSSHLPANSFSHVFCSFVLHTIKDPVRCLQEMRTVLQNQPDSGVIGLSVWGWKLDHFDIWIAACRTIDPDYELPRLADDEKCWRTELELKEKLLGAGFRDVRTAPMTMPWPFESAEQYSAFWFGPNPIAELCRKSVSAEQLDTIRVALENIVRHEYGNGNLISAQAALAVARASNVTTG